MSKEDKEQSKNPEKDSDWPDKAVDSFVDIVADLRKRVTNPFIFAAKVLVYGPLAAILVIALLVLLIIGLVSLLDTWLPQESWLVHLVLGGVFVLGGLLVWRKRPKVSPK